MKSTRLTLGLGVVALMACADDVTSPPAAGRPALATAAADGDWGEAAVAAEWAAFRAAPGTAPGVNVVEPALASLLAAAAPAAQLEVIVSYDPAATTGAAVASRLHALGAGTIGFKHLPMVFAVGTPAAVREIAALPGVESVYRNKRLSYSLYESTRSIKADAVWAFNGSTGYTGKGVGVAILDSGVDGLYHPGLSFGSKTVQNVKFVGSVKDLVTFEDGDPVKPAAALFAENVPTSETSSGHGTHVAGIAAGSGGGSSAGIYRGVAPGASLVGIGAGDVLFVFWALAGFDWLLDNHAKYGIKVVNNSWGGTGAFDPNDPTNKATYAVYKAGVTVVFAAGNCGRGDPLGVECPEPGETQLNPYSVAPWVIGVGASCKLFVQDPTNSASRCVDPVSGRAPVLADFSSVGVPNTIYKPDVVAPGVRVVSARSPFGPTVGSTAVLADARSCNIGVQHVQYYTCLGGTSMAAPHVAGVVALLQEANGGRLTPDQVLGVLKKTAVPLPGYAEWEVGTGHVDAYAAVKKVRR
jgi:serine protease AprX